MPITEGLEEDLAALTAVLPVIEGSGSRTTTIDVPTLRRLYDAALEGRDLQRLMDAAQDDADFDALSRLSIRAGLIWDCPIDRWQSASGEPCEQCGRTKAQVKILVAAAVNFRLKVDRLVELVDGPRNADGVPAASHNAAEWFAVQDVDTAEAERLEAVR